MRIWIRLIISLVLSVPFVALLLDRESEMYTTSLLMWGYGLTMGLLTVISLYSSKHYSVQTTENGEPIPLFKRSSAIREKIGGSLLALWLLVFVAYLAVSATMDTEEAYAFASAYEVAMLGPSGFVGLIGLYLFVTHKCLYCGTLNSVTSDNCKLCGLGLPKHSLKDFSGKQT